MDYEESTIIEQHIPCENCGSSDAKCVYDDGHTFCYSCSNRTFNRDIKGASMSISPKDWTPVYGEYMALNARKLSLETCKKFGYQVAEYKGKKVQVATYKGDGGIVGQKIRDKEKNFQWIGEKNPPLFGQNLFKSKGRKLVICEGEIDCMTVSQIQDHKWPVVSIPSGCAGAKKAIKNNLEWVESFEEVIFMFDMDEPGQEAAHKCIALLSPGKAKIAVLSMKDPNELHLAGKSQEILNAVWNAKEYLPSGIVNANTMWEEIQKPIEKGLSYPWPSLTALTFGIRRGEIITLGAGTGLGKTTCFKQIAYHLLKVHNEKIGLLFLEEANAMTALSLMSLEVNKPLHLPGYPMDEKKKREVYDDLFGNGNVFMFNHFGSTDFEEIKLRLRFLAVSCGVKYIFLDHVTALTSGGQQADERKEIDKIMTELASLVRELNITLFMISHLTTPEKGSHEENARVTVRQFRGSRSIGQWSSYVFALERNQQASDESERHTSTFRVLKDRYAGTATGATFKLKFDSDTQILSEIEDIRSNPFKEITESTNDFSDF